MSVIRRLDRGAALLRHHRLSQILYRITRIAQRKYSYPNPRRVLDHLGPTSFRHDASHALVQLTQRRMQLWPTRHDVDRCRAMCRGEYRFLNQVGTIQTQDSMPRLWRFHLQCQESLLEISHHCGSENAWKIVGQWLSAPQHQSPASTPDAWHPFCISRRLPIWLMLANQEAVPNSIEGAFWRSVHRQVVWLSRQLEWDLGGNHLLENLRTLVLAQSVLDLGDSLDHVPCQRLLDWLDAELDEQVLPSGEHNELTPTYHALVLLALIEIREVLPLLPTETACGQTNERIDRCIQSMQSFLASILHPDGRIPLLSDSVFDETPNESVLIGNRFTQDALGLDPVSNYWIDRSSPGNFLLFDHGPLACDHLPAHGHADLLTIEASRAGQRLIVDRGTYDYEDSESRQLCRGTSGHNTLQIDGFDHADIWSSFRMGRRGQIVRVSKNKSELASWCQATHNAYRGQDVPEVTRIVLSLVNAQASSPVWIVFDYAKALGDHRYRNPLHLHPQWNVTLEDQRNRFRCHYNGDRTLSIPDLWIHSFSSCESMIVQVEKSFYSPNFGEKHDNPSLVQQWYESGPAWSIWMISSHEEIWPEDFAMSPQMLRVGWREKVVEIPIQA